MKKDKYLIRNIGFLTIGQFASKILTFLLIPLYTNILSTAEYGTYSIYYTTIVLMVPLLTVDIAEATLRYCLDKDKSNSHIFSIGVKYTLYGTLFFSLFVVVNHIGRFIMIVDDYWYYLLIMFFTSAIYELISSYARGIEKVKAISISGIIGTIVMLVMNILLLVTLKMGLVGYFIANILGIVSQSIYLIIATKCWKSFNIRVNDKKLNQSMVSYSFPMMGNKIAWWVNDASDKYIVTWICGAAENGIYSVGYKIPSLLSIIQTIFNQAWTLSSVKDFDKEDKDCFFSNSYTTYNCIMVLVCSLTLLFNKFLAKLLYANEFYLAWQYTPYLLVSVVFGAMSGYFGGIFAAVKKTNEYGFSTILGAVINTILNILLISKIGIQGAAISTMLSNIIVWCIRLLQVKKYIKIRIKTLNCIMGYLILIIQATVLIYLKYELLMYIIQLLCFIVLLILFSKHIISLIEIVLKRIKGKG